VEWAMFVRALYVHGGPGWESGTVCEGEEHEGPGDSVDCLL
jgi:hypothetical protein